MARNRNKSKRLKSKPYALRNMILSRLGFKTYRSYLKSALWNSIRTRVLSNNPTCVSCGSAATQVHHSKYTWSNMKGNSLKNLVSVCGDCHFFCEFEDGKKVSLDECNQAMGLKGNRKKGKFTEEPGAPGRLHHADRDPLESQAVRDAWKLFRKSHPFF